MTITHGFVMTGVAGRDRATGLIVGMAAGDALGAGFEFAAPVKADEVYMKGGGLGDFEPGEWTDDTSMAIPILECLAEGRDLLDPASADAVAARWAQWYRVAADVGNTTSAVLRRYDSGEGANSLLAAAESLAAAGLACAGNGSLMRTAPVTLGLLDEPDGLTAAAIAFSDLTHADEDAADACVLMTHAQRHAILHSDFDIRVGLPYLPQQRQTLWEGRIRDAERGAPHDFTRNGWVVEALQAAWSAIINTPAAGPDHLEKALRVAVSIGHDTDTVAAIAGSLLGAKWGVSAIPLTWRGRLHGWPGLTDGDLLRLVDQSLSGQAWPRAFPAESVVTATHPRDPGLRLGGVSGLGDLDDVDVVVSLCRLGTSQTLANEKTEHYRVWLIDSADPGANPHLDHVVRQTVASIEQARTRGQTVFLHCVEGRSRTPLIAAAYGAAMSGGNGLDELRIVQRVLHQADPNALFMDYLATVRGRGSSAVDSIACNDEGTTRKSGA